MHEIKSRYFPFVKMFLKTRKPSFLSRLKAVLPSIKQKDFLKQEFFCLTLLFLRSIVFPKPKGAKMETVGKTIRSARKAKGMRMEDLSSAIGKGLTAIHAIENDALKGGPDPETVIRIADVLCDDSILMAYLEDNPVYRAIIPRIFPDLNNIRRDPAIIFSRFADEAEEAVEAARILSQVFSNASPENTPNFREVFAAKMEQIIDVQRCAEILMLQLIEAGVMSDEDRRDLHDRQQKKCEERGHHKCVDGESLAANIEREGA
jgi:transcriptional regulator with XRE-family HTH domain